ncbi:hypothetical protein [Azospirillum palustre]
MAAYHSALLPGRKLPGAAERNGWAARVEGEVAKKVRGG